MSYLSLGLNLPAMFVLDPWCMLQKAAASQSQQVAYAALLVRLHSSQRLITEAPFSTEEIIASPVQSELEICVAAVSTSIADQSMATRSIESAWSFDVLATNLLVLSQPTTSAVPTDDSELSFCNQVEEQAQFNDFFQQESDHSCLDLSFDLEASFGDHHTSVHFNNEFDFETSFQGENDSSMGECYFSEDSLEVQSVQPLSNPLQTSSSGVATLSQEETPHFEIYNQMLEDLLGFSDLMSFEPVSTPLPSNLSEPNSLASTTAHVEADMQESSESLIENSIMSFYSRSELENFFADMSHQFELNLGLDDEASFGDQHLSVHVNEFYLESSCEIENHVHLDRSHCLEESFDVQEANNSAEDETRLEIYNQMLQDLLGSALNSMESTATPSSSSTVKTFIRPRRHKSSNLTISELSKSCSTSSLESTSDLCDSCDSSPEAEAIDFSSSPKEILGNSFHSIHITDELEDHFIEDGKHSFCLGDQSLDIDMLLKDLDLNHSFCFDISHSSFDLDTYLELEP
ncbi:uncharacterized protein MELLADRAFT_68549 [Melampsora larici-populina 98AG31]|uniref:Uncharacterized protein n=1 Tax=Melampsora larici-populina (strain 98AG31 / pathotype 3-4-7) TaxID=747676 RepID=F4S772_MELLP|nr:uncharacterized protein MELLADRAFT_68549 [Melampsora larici-populina 98AG31]EGF99461.1 hypothetical protein MELLADRAFT_68549 [Melampsora larici-populina 98AG31]